MFPFRKKKSRLQKAQEKIQQVVGASAHSLGDRAGETLQAAQSTLQGVLEVAPEKIGGVKETVQSATGTALESAGGALHGAGDTLHEAASRAASIAQSAASLLGAHAHSLKNKADSLRGAAMDSTSDALQSTLENASTLSDHVREHAGDALEHAKDSALEAKDNALKSARKMKKQREKQAREAAKIAQRALKEKQSEASKVQLPKVELPKAQLPAPPAVSFENSGEKWLWLLVGVAVGAALGVLLAPNAGRRTRAALKDKISGGKGAAADLGESVARRAQNLSNRAAGAAHEFSVSHSGDGADDEADDVTIADRVRTELGRLEKEHGLERLNVDSCDGVVTLRGPVHESQIAEALVAAAQKVHGVREVKNEMATEGEGASFVG